MKVDWAAAVAMFKEAFAANIDIHGVVPEHTRDLMDYFKLTNQGTDTFHPFDEDGELHNALVYSEADPSKWEEWKSGRKKVRDSLALVFVEMELNLRDHFQEPANFPPGYHAPRWIAARTPWDKYAEVFSWVFITRLTNPTK